jgi:hypothetical protein
MTNILKHQSNEYVKLLLSGDAKSGKTGSLVSLVRAGYLLRILDMDNLLDILKFLIAEQCPELAGNVEFRTLRDRYKATPGGAVIDGVPRAFIDAVRMIDKWSYTDGDGTQIDLGKPAEWGPDCILVIDSLSRLCDAAFDWREPLTPRGKSGDYDQRATYGDAQDAVSNMLMYLTSHQFQTNVIVMCHGQYIDLPNGKRKIFPQGVGQKLSPKIPQYFPTYIRYRNEGGNRTIQTISDEMIDLANPRPSFMSKTYPVETGLAEVFAVLRDPPKAKPKLVRRT